jgi:hypothetical protein
MKIRTLSLVVPSGKRGGQTDRHDEAQSSVPQFCERG